MLQANLPLEALEEAADAGLSKHYGGRAELRAAAPGRVNLIGEHIDYCDGYVLPFAIERYIVISAARNGRQEIRVHADGLGEARISLTEPQKCQPPKWSHYLRGVLHGFHALGHEPEGFDACIVSSVPQGGGLSSSAALECAFATLLEGLLGISLGQKEKALLAQRAEHDFAGVPCGIMDQFASAFGERDHLVLIDCQSEETSLIPFADEDLAILIANTCVSHDLTDGGYAARRDDTVAGLRQVGKKSWREVAMEDLTRLQDGMDERIFRRSRHVITETQRTLASAAAFPERAYEDIAGHMAASHRSLRDDFEVSCAELDLMVDLAGKIGPEKGLLGSRMTGGGFGGSTVNLCRVDALADVAAELHRRYLELTGITPQLFASRPARGAHLREL